MLNITIEIHSDERNTLTDFERGILNALSGLNVGGVEVKQEAKKVETPKVVTKPTAVAPVAETLPGVDEEDPAPPAKGEATMEAAVKAATDLVSQGKAAQVKTALAGVGAKRVSELKGKAIAEFLEALDA